MGGSEEEHTGFRQVRIEILDEAQDDLIDGFRFYDSQSVGLGHHFLDSLFADIDVPPPPLRDGEPVSAICDPADVGTIGLEPPASRLVGRVRWCRERGSGWELGLAPSPTFWPCARRTIC